MPRFAVRDFHRPAGESVVGVFAHEVAIFFQRDHSVPCVPYGLLIGAPIAHFRHLGHVSGGIVGYVRCAACDGRDFIRLVVRTVLVEVGGAAVLQGVVFPIARRVVGKIFFLHDASGERGSGGIEDATLALGHLIETIVSIQFIPAAAGGACNDVAAGEAVAGPVEDVFEPVHIRSRRRVGGAPADVHDSVELILPGVLISRRAVVFAVKLDIGHLNAGARIQDAHRRVESAPRVFGDEIARRIVHNRRHPAQRIIRSPRGFEVKAHASSIRINDREPPCVPPLAGGVRVADTRRFPGGGIHHSAVALVVGENFPECGVFQLHFIDHSAGSRRVPRSHFLQTSRPVVSARNSLYCPVDARAERQHGIGGEPAERVVAVRMLRAVLVGHSNEPADTVVAIGYAVGGSGGIGIHFCT